MRFSLTLGPSWVRLFTLPAIACWLLSGCSILPEPVDPVAPSKVVTHSNDGELPVVHLPNVPVYGNGGTGNTDGGYTGPPISVGGGNNNGGYNNGNGSTDSPVTGDGNISGGDGSNSDPALGLVPAEIIQTTPTLGNYGATLRVMDGLGQVIEATVEIDTRTKDLKKITVGVGGVVWITTVTQRGDGRLTRYDPDTDTYYFKVDVNKTYADFISNTRTLHGQISPSRGMGMIYFP